MKKKNATHAAVAFEEVERDEVNPIADARWLSVKREKVWIDSETSWNSFEAGVRGLCAFNMNGPREARGGTSQEKRVKARKSGGEQNSRDRFRRA